MTLEQRSWEHVVRIGEPFSNSVQCWRLAFRSKHHRPGSAMRPNELIALLRKRPFVPFRIHLSNGLTYDIRHPDGVTVLRGAVDIGVSSDPATGGAERVDRCSLLLTDAHCCASSASRNCSPHPRRLTG